MSQGVPDLPQLFQESGPWAALVISLMTGWLVPKWVHQDKVADLKEERDFWRAQALHTAKVAETTMNLAEKVT